jgi:hypothetical protein
MDISRSGCFPFFLPFPLFDLNLPSMLAVVADDLSGMVNIDLLLLVSLGQYLKLLHSWQSV